MPSFRTLADYQQKYTKLQTRRTVHTHSCENLILSAIPGFEEYKTVHYRVTTVMRLTVTLTDLKLNCFTRSGICLYTLLPQRSVSICWCNLRLPEFACTEWIYCILQNGHVLCIFWQHRELQKWLGWFSSKGGQEWTVLSVVALTYELEALLSEVSPVYCRLLQAGKDAECPCGGAISVAAGNRLRSEDSLS